MTVSYASSRGLSSRITPPGQPQLVNSGPTTYVRPSDWLTMPTITTTDQKAAGLYAVWSTGVNVAAISATTSAGTFTVDWGDGTSTQTFASNAVATHVYDYASISDTTISTRGYKQAIIVVTPTTGNLTGINFTPTIPALPSIGWSGSNSSLTRPYLDISLGSPNLTNITGLAGGPSICPLLEQFSLYSTSSSYINYTGLFSNLSALQSVPVFNIPSTTNNLSSLFSVCSGLISAPQISISPAAGVNCTNMFNQCYALSYVPDYTFKINNATSMFVTCYSLVEAPLLDLSICTGIGAMYQNCFSLVNVPPMNTSSALIDTSNLFNNCYALEKVPYINTINVVNMSNMFNGCKALPTIPLYNTANVTDFSRMLSNCHSLVSMPLLNTSKGLDLSSMFQYCYSLEEIPPLNTANATNMSTTFAQCWSLKTIPLIDTSKVTTTLQMFYQDYSLQSIPLINTANSTNMYQMFYQCSSLTTIPALNTINVANMAGAFQACTNLNSFPTLNTSNVANFALTWYQCSALPSMNTFDSSNGVNFNGTFANMQKLRELPAINTSKGTNFTSFAVLCTSLQTVPSLNISNGVTSGSQFFNGCSSVQSLPAMDVGKMITLVDFSNCTNLSSLPVSNINAAFTVANCKFSTSDLQSLMGNLVPFTTARAFTMSNNPGADTAVAKTVSITANSAVLPMANTVGVVAGMYVYGTGINAGIPVTSTGSVSYLKANSSTLIVQENAEVMFTTAPTGLLANTRYYMRNVNQANSGTFQVSLTPGGTVVTFASNGTGVMTIGGPNCTLNIVQTVNANANVIMSGAAGVTNATAALTFRYINTNIALTKNWTVTG